VYQFGVTGRIELDGYIGTAQMQAEALEVQPHLSLIILVFPRQKREKAGIIFSDLDEPSLCIAIYQVTSANSVNIRI
jgi:hypothetical protein